MSNFSIPTWMLETLTPEQLAPIRNKAMESALTAIAPTIASTVKLAGFLEEPGSLEDLIKTVGAMQENLTKIQQILDPKPTPIQGKGLTPEAQTSKDRYERLYYYTMSHLPKDLDTKKYREIKTDPRVIQIWAQAIKLDDSGKLTASGKVKS